MTKEEVFRRKFPDFDKRFLVFSKPVVAAVDGFVVSVVSNFSTYLIIVYNFFG